MKNLNLENIISLMSDKGYVFFDNDQQFNLNIIGVRADNTGTNLFDDFICLIYRDETGAMQFNPYQATTDPGTFWLTSPINPKGTAIVIPGQYRGVWKIGKHRGKYEALVQRRPIKVWRDNNKDEVLDYEGMEEDSGYFGINMHKSNPYNESYNVDKWSAGCQVFKSAIDYKEAMDLITRSAGIYGNGFSYTLLEEKDLG